MKKLLVIIDMVNGFINEGALADKKINKITPKIVKLVQGAIKKGIPMVAFKDTHTSDDKKFETYPPHCMKGTSECELIPELKPFENKMITIEKNTTNGFNTVEFQRLISNFHFEEVVVVGCCTDICVEAFATSLRAFYVNQNRIAKISVVEDAVYTFDSNNHIAKEEHQKAIQRMQEAGIGIRTIGNEKTYSN